MGQSLQKTPFQCLPAASAQLVRLLASTPESRAEELRQPLWLAVSFGLRLDCLQAPLVRSALRATIGSRPDATPRALTAGLFFSRSFFNRLDWHSHPRPPRFASPIVPLMGNRINPVCYESGEVFFSWGRGSETGCSCCRSGPPALFPCSGGQRGGSGTSGAETGPATFLDPGGRRREAQRSGSSLWKRSFCSSGSDKNGTVSCCGHRHRALIVRGSVERNLAVATLWPSPTKGHARRRTLPGRDGRGNSR